MDSVSTTIVLPVYNGGALLEQAVRSVRDQTCEDWTLLLVDDASTDGSAERIRQYESARVKAVVHESNAGLYPRLRQAIEEYVSTEWVVILMQDDRLHSNYLAELQAQAERYPAAEALWATYDTIDEEGRTVQRGIDSGRGEFIEPGPAPWRHVLQNGCVWGIFGSFTRRELFLRVPFRRDLPHCGDYEWLMRALRLAPFLYYERPLLDIRLHAGQASARNLPKGIDLEEMLSVFQEQLATYPGDLSPAEVKAIARPRGVHALRRMGRALTQGRFADAARLGGLAWQFLNLRAGAGL